MAKEKPVIASDGTLVGGGLSKKEIKKIHMRNMNEKEIAYLRRKELIEKVWPVSRFLILFGLCFIILYPLIYMLSCAFRAQEDMNDPTVMWIPRHFTLKILQQTWQAMDFGSTLTNTLLLIGLVLMQIVVPSQISAIPQYMEFRYCLGLQPLIEKLSPALGAKFNLIDTPLTMYLPALMANGIRAGLMIFIFRQFFKGLPKELEDAAYLDGCGPFRTFVQVMIPNAGSSFLTVFLFSVVWDWNDLYVSSTFFTKNNTIALMLKNLNTRLSLVLFNSATVEVSPREQILWMEAGCLLAGLPLLIMYIFLQKYFTEGIERSGLVG